MHRFHICNATLYEYLSISVWAFFSLLFLGRRPLKISFHSSCVAELELEILRSLLAPGGVKLGCILVNQVSVLGSAAPTEILDLHHLRQHSLVKFVFKRSCRVVSLVDPLLQLEKIDVEL